MSHRDQKALTYSATAIGAAVLWGMVELVALWRSRWVTRAHPRD